MSNFRTLVGFLFLLGLIVWGTWSFNVFIIHPMNEQKRLVDDVTRRTQARADGLEALLPDVERLQREAQNLQLEAHARHDELEVLEKQMTTQGLVELVLIGSEVLDPRGDFRVRSVSKSNVVEQGQYVEQVAEVELRASLLQLVEYVNNLENLSPFVRVDFLKFEQEPGSLRSSLDVTMRVKAIFKNLQAAAAA
jgi:hypothetical protein